MAWTSGRRYGVKWDNYLSGFGGAFLLVLIMWCACGCQAQQEQSNPADVLLSGNATYTITGGGYVYTGPIQPGINGPSPFSYDVAAKYVADKLDIPVLKFEVSEFNDFSIDMNKSRAVLGLNPEYDIFKIVDDAIAFRKSGKQRTACLYPG